MQPFRVERGQLPGPAIPAECPHISAQGLQAFLAQAVRIGIIHHVLQVLLCQAGNAFLPDRGQNARAPTAFNIAAVAGAVRLFQCGIPVFIQLIHPAGLDAYPVIKPGIRLCVRFPLTGAARLRAVELFPDPVFLHGNAASGYIFLPRRLCWFVYSSLYTRRRP